MDELPEPERGRALRNIEDWQGKKLRATQHEALRDAFHWDNTPEACKYWTEIFNKLQKTGK